jgi:hypothetical protein
MRKKKNRLSHLSLIIGHSVVLLGAGVPFPTETVFSGEQQERKLPRVDGETQLYPGYPYRFDGAGIIDRLVETEIVISDVLLVFSSGVDLHTPRSSSAGIGRFEVGDYVGYQLDESGAIESLWLLQKGKR